MQVRKILIADDDDDLRAARVPGEGGPKGHVKAGMVTLACALGKTGVTRAKREGDGASAVARATRDRPDLVIMDVGLPDMDGRDAVKALRASGFSNPVIMLTAQDGEADTVKGLEAGANDYVTKPFRFAVLLARMRAHLRQHESSDDASFRIGPYVFQPGAKQLVTGNGGKLRLTEKETAILRYLYRAGQTVIAREVLLKEVWGYNAAVTTHTLETHIYRLRQKIEQDPARAVLLVTEAGGYKLVP